MFRRQPESKENRVSVTLDGETVEAVEGEPVAAVLLAEGHRAFRTTPVGGRPRGPLCMMGVCFDCLVEIDGVPNKQACLETVRAGMRIVRQDGARRLAP